MSEHNTEMKEAHEAALAQVSKEARDYYNECKKAQSIPEGVMRSYPTISSIHGFSVIEELFRAGLVEAFTAFVICNDDGYKACQHYFETGCDCLFNAYLASRLDCCGGKRLLPDLQCGQNGVPSGLTDSS